MKNYFHCNAVTVHGFKGSEVQGCFMGPLVPF
jgi:hypothetical protein